MNDKIGYVEECRRKIACWSQGNVACGCQREYSTAPRCTSNPLGSCECAGRDERR